MKAPIEKISRFGKLKTGDDAVGFNDHFTFHPSLLTSSKSAFTLAEVLITLGIIGIVAAMTLPTLVAKYKEKQLVTSYLRIYSILNSAYQMATTKYGYYNTWAQTGEDTVNKLKPYLKLKSCEQGFGTGRCFPDKIYKDIDGARGINFAVQSDRGAQSQTFQLVSGEAIIANIEDAVSFIVDLNGEKNPNTIGVDLHIFSISENSQYNMVNPGGTAALQLNNAYHLCNPNNNSSEPITGWRNGYACGWWILRHKNMDYLRLSEQEIKDKW